jgi:hypothetical protein
MGQRAASADRWCKRLGIWAMHLAGESAENFANGVDAELIWGILVIPLDSGTPLIGSSFYVHLGLQIGLNFVPEPIIEPLRRVEIPNRARD